MTYRLLVCGDRHWGDKEMVWAELDKYYELHGRELLIISGGAKGADTIAQGWAIANHIDHLIRYPRWDEEGKSAGPKRNARMLKHRPDKVLAFHDDIKESKGTRDMVTKAKRSGTKWVVKKHG